jgi:hypothetical protein
MTDTSIRTRFSSMLPGFVRRDPAGATAFGFIVILLVLGSLY